jgi:hypothetical protein
MVRLLGEYILGFLSAIQRAPLSARDRWRCRRELLVWILSHVNPLYRRRFVDSPDPAVAAIGAGSLATRITTKVRDGLGRVSALGQREGQTP